MKSIALTFFYTNSLSVIQNIISVTLLFIILGIILTVSYIERNNAKFHFDSIYREDLFHSLCSNVNEVYVIFDTINKRMEYISPNFERITGYRREEILLNKFSVLDLLFGEQKEKLRSYMQKDYSEKDEFQIEYFHPIAQKKMWFTISLHPVYAKNVVSRYICSIRDITEKIEAELEMTETLAKLQRANDAKKDFLSHMSHELKTPINAIIGMNKLATIFQDDKEMLSNYLGKIDLASKQLLTLINNILDTAKADSDKISLTLAPFSLPATLETLSSLFQVQAEQAGVNYCFRLLSITDAVIIGDSLRLGQIITNCLSNALKFTPAGGNVTLEVSQEEKHDNKALYRFLISDTGKGMQEDFINHLFLPFFQEDSSIFHKYGGSGLGMSITNELIQLMRGEINVSSKVNIGTKIRIEIVFNIAEEVSAPINDLKPEPESKIYDLKGKRILVVEDNAINLEITCEYLKLVNASVSTASSGSEAVEMFISSDKDYYDAILMDVQMPEMNGYEATKRIRSSSHPNAKSIDIIAVTADSSEDCVRQCTDSGMKYHIAKPIDMELLFSSLTATIQR